MPCTVTLAVECLSITEVTYLPKIIFLSFVKTLILWKKCILTWPWSTSYASPAEKWQRTTVLVGGPYATGREKRELPTVVGARIKLLLNHP